MGVIHIWMNRRSFELSRLCSLCRTPFPAVMNWIAPLVSVSDVPMESLCVSAPSTTYVQISMLAWPCSPKPRFGITRSSFITRSTPKESFPLLEYSANEKWNREVSQLGADQPLLSPLGLEGLPNHDGSGSDLKSLWCGTFRIGALLPNVMTAFAETIEGRARLVHADGSARMRRRHSAVPLWKTSSRDNRKSRTRVRQSAWLYFCPFPE